MKKEKNIVLAASLLVLASISISLVVENIWVGFFAAFVIAVIYLIVLDRQVVQKLDNLTHKRIIRWFVGLLVLFQLYSNVLNTYRSAFQYQNLEQIRTTIESSIAQMETERILLEALRHYYHEVDDEETSLENSFKTVMADQLLSTDEIAFDDSTRDKELDFYYQIVNSDSITITVSTQIGEGEHRDFENRNNRTGKYEGMGILTLNGVEYERIN